VSLGPRGLVALALSILLLSPTFSASLGGSRERLETISPDSTLSSSGGSCLAPLRSRRVATARGIRPRSSLHGRAVNFGGGGNGVVGPLFVLKVDPDAICLFLDGVLKPLKPPPSKSAGISLNSGRSRVQIMLGTPL
jgi:hypothetical protein